MRAAALAALALAACATARPPPWVPATSPYVAAASGFEVTVPSGWMRYNLQRDETLVITRDGTPLQRIVAGSVELGKPLGLGQGKRAVTAAMSPQEVAELVIDEITASGVSDVRLLENAPAALSSRDGFRVVAAYRDGGGLAMRIALHGASAEGRFFWLSLIAPERHYFPRDLASFEAMVKSFRLKARAPAPAAS